MSKKLIASIVLCLGLVLYSQPASATLIHNAVYDWYDSNGTRVKPDPGDPYNIGNVSGSVVLQVWEKVFDVGNGMAEYSWTLTNDAYNEVFSFHVLSTGSYPYGYNTPAPSGGGDAWNFSNSGIWYIWQTPSTTDGLDLRESITFTAVTDALKWDISNGAVDYLHGDGRPIADGNGYWRVSHPTPEPGSMLLLGMGILGLLGIKRRKVI